MNPAKSFSGLLFLGWILKVSIGAFLDYGINASDTGLGAVDDRSFTVNMRSTIKFWNINLSTLYINSNGVISSSTYSSTASTWPQAPNNSLHLYHTDAIFNSHCGSCNIYYRTVISIKDLNKINNLLRSKNQNFAADREKTLVTTWYNASQYGKVNKTNTFQCILTSDGEKTYAILSYDKLQYHNEDASKFAKAGFKVSGNQYCNFIDTRQTMKLQCRSNVFSPGLFVVGLTPNAEYQCNIDGKLSTSCSHCPGEEWFRKDCNNNDKNTTACGSNGVLYRSKCEVEKEICRTGEYVIKKDCTANFTFCDFEKDTCGLVGSNWIRRTGSLATKKDGPSVDANGNAFGFFYHFKASGLLPFSDHMISVTVPNPSKSYRACLEFAYYMHGTHVGALSVMLSAKNKPFRIAWTRVGNQGPLWRRKAISLQNVLNSFGTNSFKLMIVATKGRDFQSDIAIDDLSVNFESNCTPMKNFTFCDFEKDNCGFTGSNWTRRGGQVPTRSTLPSVDASGNTLGLYFHFDARLSQPFSVHPISVLIPNPSKNTKGCLKFAYHMHGTDIGSLSVILSASNVLPRTVWFAASDLESMWEETAVSLEQILNFNIPSYFNLIFVAMKGNRSRGEIAIDNVLVTYGSNCAVIGNTLGFYFHFDARLAQPYSVHPVSVLIPNHRKKSKGCLKFAYHIYGTDTGSLSVILSASSVLPRTVWVASSDMESMWKETAVSLEQILNFTIPLYFKLTFVAMKGNRSRGEIAIDNVLVTYGSNCAVMGNFTFCDFEKDNCGFTGSNWTRRGGQGPNKSTLPSADARGNTLGFYFHFNTRLAQPYSVHPISVLIPNPRKNSKGCLKFAYHIYGTDTGSLSVILSGSNVLPRTVWFTAGGLESMWKETAVSLQQILNSTISSYFNLTFVALKGNGSRGEIAIDNVLVTYGSNCVVIAKTTPRTTAVSEQNTDLKKVIVIATGGFVFGQIIFLLICVIIRRKAVNKHDDTQNDTHEVQAHVEKEDDEDYEVLETNESYYANVQALQLDKQVDIQKKNTNPIELTEVEMRNTTINEYTSIDN